MTLSEKISRAMHDMFRRAILIYWVGGGLATLALQIVFADDFAQIDAIITQMQQPNADTAKIMAQLQLHGAALYGALLMLIPTCLVMAKGLDSAKQLSEGHLSGNDLAPVPRIGWGGFFKYVGGSFVVAAIAAAAAIIILLLATLLAALLGPLIGGILSLIATVAVLIIVMYVLYASTLIFIETLSFNAMITPAQWLAKIRTKVDKRNIGAMIVILILLSIAFGILGSIIEALSGTLADTVILFISKFLTMFSFIWIGYFTNTPAATQADYARLLYEADTHGMSAQEKRTFAEALQQADKCYNADEYDKAVATLMPYTQNDVQAARHYPAYQRLYQWQRSSNTHMPLRARLIRLAAQGNERFYQLIAQELFDIASENNAQLPADDIYPLAQMALKHAQPETVLALAKDFRKRHEDHPDVINVYACVIRALQQQGQNDIAQEVGTQLIEQYPNHPDIEKISSLMQH